MGISCFPVSVQMGSNFDNQNNNRNFEIDLIGEVAGRIIDLASRVSGRESRTPSLQERLGMAKDTATDAATLYWLAADEFAAVRSEVVFNPATPCMVLERLVNDTDKFVAAQARAQISMKCAA